MTLSEKQIPTYCSIPMPRGVSARFDARTGETCVSFVDGVAVTAPLGVSLSHVHNAKRVYAAYGKGFALSLDETLSKQDVLYDYTYTDATGQEYGFMERFYYEENGTAFYVNAEDVTVNEDGELIYRKVFTPYPVKRVLRSSAGWELITKLDDVKNKELYDRYTEEEKKVKEYKEALCEYVSVSVKTGEIGEKLADPSFLDYNKHAPDGTTMFMPYSDALSYRALCLQRQTLVSQTAAYDLQLDSLTLQKNSLTLQQSSTELQKRSNALQKANYEDQSTIQTNEAKALRGQRAYYARMVNDVKGTGELTDPLPEAWAYIAELPPERLDKNGNETSEYKLWCAQVTYYNLVCQHRLADSNAPVVEKMANALKNGDNEAFYKIAEEQETLLQEQVEQITSTLMETDKQKEQIEAEKNNLSQQLSLCDDQIAAFEARASHYYETFQELLISYLKAVEQMPVSYLQKDGIVKGFNRNGLLVAVFDSNGNAIAIERDINDRITHVYDAQGNGVELFYKNSKLVSLTDLRGDRVRYAYDGDMLTTVTYADGTTLYFAYDNKGNICSVYSDGDSSDKMRSDLTYDTQGRLISAQKLPLTYALNHNVYHEAEGDVISGFGVSYGTRTVVTDNQSGDTAVYGFDGWNNLSEYYETKNGLVSFAEKTERGYADSNRYTTVYTAGAPLLYKKPLSEFSFAEMVGMQKTHTEYDTLRRAVSSRTEAVSPTFGTGEYAGMNEYAYSETAYTYNASGMLALQTTVKGVGCYDPATGTKAEQSPYANHIVEYAYTAQDKLLRRESYTDEKQYTEGKTVEEWVYDDKGRLVRSFTYSSLDPSSKFYTESLVDEKGRTIAELDATGRHKTTFAYDAFGTLVSETYPNGATLAYAAAPDGRATAITQSTAEGESGENTTLYTAGEVTRIVSGDCAVGYRYDSKRRLIEVDLNDTFHVGWVRAEGVKEAGEKEYTTETYYANGEKTRTVCDSHGNVKSKELGYDTAEEMTMLYTAEYETDGRPKCVKDAAGDTVQSFVYDEKHRLVSILDGAEQYGYDTSDRLVSRTVSVGEDTQAYTYTYDTVTGRLTKTTVDGISVTPKYDLLGRSVGKTVENSENKTIEEKISYLKVGDHATALPSAVAFYADGKRAEGIQYGYDSMGNIVKVLENGRTVYQYEYDGFGRITRENNAIFGKTSTWAYDSNGNILARYEYVLTATPTDELYTLNGNCVRYEYDQKSGRLVSYNGENFVYDEIGNPTTYRGRSAVWSYGRLASIDGNTFSYDVLGRRASKNDIAFTYDGNGNLIRQSNGLEFLYDHTGVFAVKHNNTTYFYRKDAQANIVALLDNTGAVVVKYKYDAWGNCKVLNTSGLEITDDTHIGILNPFRYRSYYYDHGIGLYFLKTRYYDPETGKFLTPDSIEYLDPETIGGLNLYAYCNNNPVMFSDPEGHSFILTSLAIIGIATLLGATSSAIVSGAVYTLENPAGDARGFWASVAGGAVSGAIMGAFAGAVLITGIGAGAMVAWSAAVGAFSGAAGSLTEGAINGKLQANSWDYFVKDVIPSALWGAATGALFGVMTGAVHSAKSLADVAGRPLAKQLTNILRYQVLKKAGSILTENLLGDFTAWVMELFGRKAFNGMANAFD